MPGKRRGNGEGTITQRPDGTWRGSLTLPDGRRKDFRAETQEEARRTLTRLTRERDQGALMRSDERLTVEAFLLGWLERRKPHLRMSSRARYAEHVAHIIRALGKVRLAKLRANHVERMYAQLLDSGLSGSSVAQAHTILKSTLKDAMRKRILSVNVCEMVETSHASHREIHPLDETQANAFLLAARGERRFEALFILALRTGMRQGELLALHWQDVDLERGTLLVRLSLRRLKGGGYEFNQPKTKAGRRTITLTPTVIDALKAHRVEQNKDRLFLGPAWQDNDLVFPSTIGTPQDAAHLATIILRRVLDNAELPRIRFHDLRHTCATLLLLRGIDANTVKDLLGHSNITITLGTYGHVLPNMRDRVAEMMDAILAPSTAG
jgi:integrase